MELKVQERVKRKVKVSKTHPRYANETGERLPVRAPSYEELLVWVRLDSGEVPLISPSDLEDIT